MDTKLMNTLKLLHTNQLYDGLFTLFIQLIDKTKYLLFFPFWNHFFKKKHKTLFNIIQLRYPFPINLALNSEIGMHKTENVIDLCLLEVVKYWTFFLSGLLVCGCFGVITFNLCFPVFPFASCILRAYLWLIWISKDAQPVQLTYLTRIRNFILVLPGNSKDTLNNTFEKSM